MTEEAEDLAIMQQLSQGGAGVSVDGSDNNFLPKRKMTRVTCLDTDRSLENYEEESTVREEPTEEQQKHRLMVELASSVFRRLNVLHEEKISYEALQLYAKRALSACDTPRNFDIVDFEHGFRKLDHDNDGFISFDDVLHTLKFTPMEPKQVP